MRLIIKRKAEAPRKLDPGRPYASIDPGVDGSGWSLFVPGRVAPAASGAVEVGRAGEWGQRAARTALEVHRRVLDAACELPDRFRLGAIRHVFIEEPQFMEGGRGIVAARAGDLVKLCILAGMIGGEFASAASDMEIHFVEVRVWKGSMPKDVTKRRVLEKLKGTGWRPAGDTTHEMDAVGLGLFVKGVL